MRIQHNIAALNSHRNLMNNNNAVAKNLEKLSSGYRINRAGDDAAGLAISEKMRAQITGLETAQKNAQDGISLVQTAEGALTEVHSMLNRMVELATQSANGTYDDKIDRDNLQKEMDALVDEIDRISKATNFNGINLLDGTMKNPGDTAVDPEGAPVTVGALTSDTVNFNDGANGTTYATIEFDVAGVTFDKDGSVTAKIAGQEYNVNVTKDMTEADFAKALVAAINDNKIEDADAGEFTASASGTTITLTSDTQAPVASADIKAANKIEIAGTEAAAGVQAAAAAGTPAYTAGTTFEYDFSALTNTDNPTANDTIILAGQTFTAVTSSTGADGEFEIGANIADTLSNLADAIGNHADLKDKFTAEVTDGKLVLTATKDAAAGDTEPGAPTGTWTAGAAVAAPDVTKPEAEGEAGKTGELTLQIGDTAKDYNKITLKVGDMGAEALGLKTGEDVLSIKTQGDAANAIDTIKKAINTVSSTRGDLGAIQNRLEHTINNLSVTTENMTAAESRIRDVDMAKEMMAYTKNNILVQASQAMLAQANQLPQGVLQLLQ